MNKEEIEAKYYKYIEKTKKYILPECEISWEHNIWDVLEESSDFENTMNLAIEIIEKLEHGATTDEIKELLDNSGIEKSSKTFESIRELILFNSKKGPEFYEQTAYEELSPLRKNVIENIKQRNEKWESTREERNRLEEQRYRLEEKFSECVKKSDELIRWEQKRTWRESVRDEFEKSSDFGNYMDVAIEIMEKLENGGTADEIKGLLDNSSIEKSSFDTIRKLILTTAKKGPEFYEQTAYEELSPEEKKHIEDIKQRNTEFDKSVEQKNKFREDFESYIEKTERFIFPDSIVGWRKSVWEFFDSNSDYSDFANHMDVAIEIMGKLEKGATTDEIKGLLDNSGIEKTSHTFTSVRELFLVFAEKGPEFYEQTAYKEISPEMKEVIENIKQRNEKFYKLHEANSTKEVSEERRTEEQEISNSFKEKENLKLEISNIEQKIAVLRAEEAELKKLLNEKQSQIKGLDENS